MNLEDIRAYCISKPDTEESLPFGPDNVVFKTNGRIFLILSLDTSPVQFNVKCDPEKAIRLREEFSCVVPGYHMNKKHWNTILVDGSVSPAGLKEWIDHSYDLVRKK